MKKIVLVEKRQARLLKAARDGDLDTVKRVHHDEEDVDINDSSLGYTALTTAAVQGHLQIVKYLVENGASPFAPFNGKSSREYALEKDREDIAEYLLSVMKSPRVLNGKFYHTPPPSICISSKDCNKRAQELIELGADVCRLGRRKRPLVYAVEANSIDLIKLLLQKGADISCVSALERALDLFLDEIAQILIEANPRIVNAKLSAGSTPLIKSITYRNVKMVKYLIEKGANPLQKNPQGVGPLDKALEMHSIETAEFLYSKMHNLELALTPTLLYNFAQDGMIEVYEFLLKNNWDINQTDVRGKTSLALSASNRHLLLTKFLIENGADLNAAKEEIDNFRQEDLDFDFFMETRLLEKEVQANPSSGEKTRMRILLTAHAYNHIIM